MAEILQVAVDVSVAFLFRRLVSPGLALSTESLGRGGAGCWDGEVWCVILVHCRVGGIYVCVV